MYTVIIVDYKSITRTIRYIECLYEKIVNDFNVVIVSNGGENTEIDKLKEIFEYCETINFDNQNILKFSFNGHDIAYCNPNENLGFARGNNLGAKISKYLYFDDYYIFSNNDIALPEAINLDDFKKVIEENKNIAVVGPRVKDLDEKDQSPRKRISAFKYLVMQYWGNVLPLFWGKGDFDYTEESKQCYWTSGCFMFVDAKIFELVDGFDSNTFLYAEEMILSERLKKKGYGYYFINDICIIHEEGSTTKDYSSTIETMRRMLESNCYFYKTYRKTPELLIKFAKFNFRVLFDVIYPKWKNKISKKECP